MAVDDKGLLYSKLFAVEATRAFAGSPLYRELALEVSQDPELIHIARKSKFGAPPHYLFLSAVHALLLSGIQHPLSRYYPSISPQNTYAGPVYPVFRDFVLTHSAEIEDIISKSNFNKSVIRRSACLRAMLAACAEARGWNDVHLIDIGCGAGLNLFLDHWRIDSSGYGCTGPDDAEVMFSIQVKNSASIPMNPFPRIISRIGLDRDCIDTAVPGQRNWILGNLFPDHVETFKLTDHALSVLSHFKINIVVGDAAKTLPNVLEKLPDDKPVVLMHALLLYKMPIETRQSITSSIRNAAAERPIATLGMEPAGAEAVLTIKFDGEPDPRIVGKAQNDGYWMTWDGL